MFEARLVQGGLLKKVVEAIKDLVTDANFECTSSGFGLQAMDTSHVALVGLKLRADGFEHFRCDRDINLGMNLANMGKMLKTAGNDDIITISAKDDDAKVAFVVEAIGSRVGHFELMMMDIESEHLGIPDTDYEVTVKMPSGEFQRIIRDLASFGDSVTITATKDGVNFSTRGDIGAANITCKQNTATERDEDQVVIQLREPVSLNFSLRYFSSFTKATPLSEQVIISMSKDLPVVVEYPISDMGALKFFLAPKMDEEDEMED